MSEGLSGRIGFCSGRACWANNIAEVRALAEKFGFNLRDIRKREPLIVEDEVVGKIRLDVLDCSRLCFIGPVVLAASPSSNPPVKLAEFNKRNPFTFEKARDFIEKLENLEK
ncbi:MAG: hypothetical protein AAB373_00615 [Patescibacteria group bacterium]